MPSYLSKSDFKVARDCPAKLYYRKLGYPSAKDHDDYLDFLKDGGYMVETLAKLLHPEGVEIGFEGGLEEAAAKTMRALRKQNVTLFEATLVWDQYCARVDILKKVGNRFELIEVKAKSVSSSDGQPFFRGKRGELSSGWIPYLEDVAYQTYLLRKLLPGAEVVPFLRLVDKSKRADGNCIFSQFELRERNSVPPGKFARPEVKFFGNTQDLRRSHILISIDVTDEVDQLMPEAVEDAKCYAKSIEGELKKIPVSIGTHCRDCEYRNATTDNDQRDGFGECWGTLAKEDPHILDYYNGSLIGGRNNSLIDVLVNRGRASLSDVAECDLVNADGAIGPIARRQRIQRKYTLLGEEYVSRDLSKLLSSFRYPRRFIDFETSRIAVPYHAGMHPYEQVAFQWSCHTLPAEGAPLEHREWINLEDAYPNFKFAETLMECLGETGTVFVWSHHEQSALRDIARQMRIYGYENSALAKWLGDVAGTKDVVPSRLTDLCDLAKKHYFHPKMKGRLSIKYVLPAIWEENHELHKHASFARYFRTDSNRDIIDPYQTLPSLPFGNPEDDTEEAVTEGSGAMRAYQEMLYGLSKHDDQIKAKWRKLLLQYCQLDTAAMVIIWLHWKAIGAKLCQECRSLAGQNV
jgi:hypothetical protein